MKGSEKLVVSHLSVLDCDIPAFFADKKFLLKSNSYFESNFSEAKQPSKPSKPSNNLSGLVELSKFGLQQAVNEAFVRGYYRGGFSHNQNDIDYDLVLTRLKGSSGTIVFGQFFPNIETGFLSIFKRKKNHKPFPHIFNEVTDDEKELLEAKVEELRLSEARLKGLSDIAQIGTWEYNYILDYFIVGENVLNILEIDKTKDPTFVFSLRSVKSFIHPDDLYLFEAALNRKLADESIEYLTFRLVTAAGAIKNVLASIKLVRDKNNRIVNHFGTLQDISGLMSSQSERNRLINICEATTDIVGIIDKDLSIKYVNKAGKDFFAIDHLSSKNKLKKLKAKALLNKAQYRTFKDSILPIIERRGTWSGEFAVDHFSGKEHTISWVLIGHKNAKGKIEYYSTILRDITARKKIEKDLINKNKELDTFVYRASHDLRGPVASLLGLHEVVKLEITDETVLEYFSMFHKQISRLNKVILNLISLTRINNKDDNKTNINLKSIVDGLFDFFSIQAKEHGIRLKSDIKLTRRIVAEEALLATILQNLIENSIKYHQSLIDNPFVKVRIRDYRKDSILIEVTDNGIGIEQENLEKVFQMFFRGSEKSIGSGLGLYILKSSVEKLGGKIKMTSAVGRGTTTKIILPAETLPEE